MNITAKRITVQVEWLQVWAPYALDELERVMNIGFPLFRSAEYVTAFTAEGNAKLLELEETLGYAITAIESDPAYAKVGEIIPTWLHLWDAIRALQNA